MKETRRLFRTAFPVLLIVAALLAAALAVLLALRHAAQSDAAALSAVSVSPAPSPAPTETPLPTASPAPTAYVPAPPTFFADAAQPLLDGAALSPSDGVPLFGMVTSGEPMLTVGALIVSDVGEDPAYPVERSVVFDAAENVTAYALSDAPRAGETPLAEMLRDTPLTAGRYTLFLSVGTSSLPEAPFLAAFRFTVLGDAWKRIEKRDFNGAYEEALAFFSGDTARFLYRYQPVWGRYVVADPAWEETYLAYVDMGCGGEPWRVHRDAVPYYERVRTFLERAHVRVRGTNGDTGVLPLHQLIAGYFGSYNSRMTSSKKWISHHAFGTATDLNADMPPNGNTKANKALIDREVGDCLHYNGVAEEYGVSYYDFTYSGDYEGAYLSVPETVINYLLYELAFYRAGFQWGHYYNSTSDGMHFTLTDRLIGRHDANGGLRKVYEYTE